ncbi:MAG: hypothetical protein HY286_00315 [Planctomycetes bacterium]|nr:hypothetical protein [Planctomycetota bacterium]
MWVATGRGRSIAAAPRRGAAARFDLFSLSTIFDNGLAVLINCGERAAEPAARFDLFSLSMTFDNGLAVLINCRERAAEPAAR